MNFKHILSSNLILFGSLFILILVLLFFRFSSDPPRITNVFSPTKPGTLIFESDPEITINKPFKVRVIIDSNKQSVNAVGLYLTFDKNRVQIVDIDTTQSFCQFYPEKKFDNNLGTVSLTCGAPHPGSAERNTLLELEFLPLTSGVANLLVDPKSKILLSDGKGTNILQPTDLRHEINIATSL